MARQVFYKRGAVRVAAVLLVIAIVIQWRSSAGSAGSGAVLQPAHAEGPAATPAPTEAPVATAAPAPEDDAAAYLTEVQCIGGKRPPWTRSCRFKNLYWLGEGFATVRLRGKPLPEHFLNLGPKRAFGADPYWEPQHLEFDNAQEVKEYFAARNVVRKEGPSLVFNTIWAAVNVGHGMFDGLYPAFTAAFDHGLAEEPIRMIPGDVSGQMGRAGAAYCEGLCANFCLPAEELCDVGKAIKAIAIGGEFLPLCAIPERHPGEVLLFEDVVAGSGERAQRAVYPEAAIYEGRDGVMEHFRDRLFQGFGVQLKKRQKGDVVKALVISNKRYSPEEIAEIQAAIAELDGKDNFSVQWIEWPQYPGLPRQFELLSDADIYLSGPGTGLLNHMYMREGSVLVNVGEIRSRLNNRFPSFIEQYIAEGTPYQRALYYPSNKRMHGIKGEEISKLLLQAKGIVEQGFKVPVPPLENLSVEGKIFSLYCTENEEEGQDMLDHMNGNSAFGWDRCTDDGWLESVVYEAGGWQLESQLHDGVHCTLNRERLKKLRDRYEGQLGWVEG
ncbi:unnamed protein product [Pedinophyceae sp. YPF-701]|nr:unnamed protein product [Pedinophyceae sp. YPF-701]